MFAHVAPSASFSVPITAGNPEPARFAPSLATTVSILAVVVFFVLLKVVVSMPVAALTVTVPWIEWPFRSMPVSRVPLMV